jgi:hypothetical protein
MKSMSPLLNKLFLVITLVALLVVLLMLTDPNKVALPILIAPFICIGLIIYQLTKLFLSSTKKNIDNKAARMFAISVAFLGVALLLLRSLHQLTLKDTLLVCGFALAFWLYIWRADFLHK